MFTMKEIVCVTCGGVLAMSIAFFCHLAGTAQATPPASPVIALQVEWRSDGTFVNGRKVSDGWVAVVPPQQQQTQQPQPVAAESVVPLPEEKKSEPTVKPTVEPIVESTAEPIVEEAATVDVTDIIPLPAPVFVPPVKVEPVNKPAPVNVSPIKQPRQREVIRRGLFGRRVIVRDFAEVYTPCKPSEKGQCTVNGQCSSGDNQCDTVSSQKQVRRFGGGRILRSLFRPFSRAGR